jgi:hypothetical protein
MPRSRATLTHQGRPHLRLVGRDEYVTDYDSPLPEETCDHLRDTTSRYDHRRKLLSFLLVCDVCGTERVVETLPYEPRFEPFDDQARRLAA